MADTLYTFEDDLRKYVIKKEISGNGTAIIAYKWINNRNEYEEVDRVTVQTGAEYQSPFLSWYNHIFCSNMWCGGKYSTISPDYDYMTYAVQNGKKTAATVYISPDSEEGKRLVSMLPSNCGSLPYGESMIYVFHKGRLADYFDFDRIKAIYKNYCRAIINWGTVKSYFEMPLEVFGDTDKCGFDLHNARTNEQKLVTGLTLGYPVESTVLYIR